MTSGLALDRQTLSVAPMLLAVLLKEVEHVSKIQHVVEPVLQGTVLDLLMFSAVWVEAGAAL